MRYLVFGDLQATDGSELCFSQPNKTLQHYRVEKFYADVLRIYTENKCNGIVDLGDTTDDRSSIPMDTLEVVGAGIERLPEGSLWKITGNHEQQMKWGGVNNRYMFKHIFNVVDDRRIQMMGDWAAFFVSYPADHAELTEWLLKEARRVRGPKVLFGHFQAVGAFYKGGTALTGVPMEALEPFSQVLLGHIHIPQSLTPKIHYVGSPFQQDWGEASQEKRVGILDTATMRTEWVPLTGYPEYRAVGIQEFKQMVEEGGEHRYKVKLNSHAESEEFFRHPAFSRALAEYNYDETPVEPGAEVKDWSFEGTCRRYLKMVPLAKVGIELSEDEMIGATELIIGK